MHENAIKVGQPVKPEPALILLLNRLKCIKDITTERKYEFEELLTKLSGSGLPLTDIQPVKFEEANNCFINDANNLLDDVDYQLSELLQISKRFSEII